MFYFTPGKSGGGIVVSVAHQALLRSNDFDDIPLKWCDKIASAIAGFAAMPLDVRDCGPSA